MGGKSATSSAGGGLDAGAGADRGAGPGLRGPGPAHHGQVVPRTQTGLEEERGAAAAQLALGDNGDAVAQQVRLVHVVGGQDDGPV